MVQIIKPIVIALKGKGLAALTKRVLTIGRRYSLTAAKMDRELGQLSRVLQEFSCRATFPITTVALARNSAVIKKYQALGIEFAVHGYRHIDHSQLSLGEQENYLYKAGETFRNLGIHFEGFRSPYLRWNDNTLTALRKTHFSYDSSPSLFWDIPERHTTDSYYRALSFYGANPIASYPALPHLEAVTNLVQIPYCLPDDESLIERLKWNSALEMAQIWPAMFCHIHERGELFTLGLHPERTSNCLMALLATLQEVHTVKSTVWCARLSEIAAWWKARCTAEVEINENNSGLLHLRFTGPEGTTLLARSLDVKTPTKPWFDGYQQAMSLLVCVAQTNSRPFIGASPGTTPVLINFLKQQGYIVEVSSESKHYSFYLDRTSFSREEERPLLAQIEAGNFPLIRFGRWPDGARSALCITGDIDALTLWDYGLRFLGR